MSDRIPAEIWIGGKIAVSLVPALCAAIEAESVSLEWGGSQFSPSGASDLREALKEDAEGVALLWLCDDATRWGEFSDLEIFLQRHEISYTRRSDGNDAYEPERVEFRPGFRGAHVANTDRSGKPVVPAKPLVEIEAILTKAIPLAQAGKTRRVTTALRAATKKLQQVLPPAVPPLPPFEIVAAGRKTAPAIDPTARPGHRNTASPRTRKDTAR